MKIHWKRGRQQEAETCDVDMKKAKVSRMRDKCGERNLGWYGKVVFEAGRDKGVAHARQMREI